GRVRGGPGPEDVTDTPFHVRPRRRGATWARQWAQEEGTVQPPFDPTLTQGERHALDRHGRQIAGGGRLDAGGSMAAGDSKQLPLPALEHGPPARVFRMPVLGEAFYQLEVGGRSFAGCQHANQGEQGVVDFVVSRTGDVRTARAARISHGV